MIDIVDRLSFDATRCEIQFSKGVASNIEAGIVENKRLRAALKKIEDRTTDPVARSIAGEILITNG